jgi:hypothetical protein
VVFLSEPKKKLFPEKKSKIPSLEDRPMNFTKKIFPAIK